MSTWSNLLIIIYHSVSNTEIELDLLDSGRFHVKSKLIKLSIFKTWDSSESDPLRDHVRSILQDFDFVKRHYTDERTCWSEIETYNHYGGCSAWMGVLIDHSSAIIRSCIVPTLGIYCIHVPFLLKWVLMLATS